MSSPMGGDQPMMIRGPRPMYTAGGAGMPPRPPGGMMVGQRPPMGGMMTAGGPRGQMIVGGQRPPMGGGMNITTARESAQAQHAAKWEADELLGQCFFLGF